MAEELVVPSGGNKEEKYIALLPQLEALVDPEAGFIANAANCAAALHQTFGHLWTGFYLVKQDSHAPETHSAENLASENLAAENLAAENLAAENLAAENLAAGTLASHGELVLGPFQGPIACTRIGYGRGVCGTAWKEGRTLIVPDVNEFPGHIACSSASRSEIVVPVFNRQSSRHPDGNFRRRIGREIDWAPGRHEDEEIIAVLDIDSSDIGTFDETDKKYLEKICSLLA